MDIQKKCSVCNIEKSLDSFYKSQRGTKCIDCVLKVTREYKRKKRLDSNFRKEEGKKQKERRIRLWQNTLIHDSKYRGIENNLTVEIINKIYKKQNGLCCWFNIPLIPTTIRKHPQQPSIDRLDRNKGYTEDNIVLCCYSANIGRNETDLNVWLDFLKLLNLK
jgi:hypothetical protein